VECEYDFKDEVWDTVSQNAKVDGQQLETEPTP
jgi:hypothetical protein